MAELLIDNVAWESFLQLGPPGRSQIDEHLGPRLAPGAFDDSVQLGPQVRIPAVVTHQVPIVHQVDFGRPLDSRHPCQRFSDRPLNHRPLRSWRRIRWIAIVAGKPTMNAITADLA
jgi:hypothetical protein